MYRVYSMLLRNGADIVVQFEWLYPHPFLIILHIPLVKLYVVVSFLWIVRISTRSSRFAYQRNLRVLAFTVKRTTIKKKKKRKGRKKKEEESKANGAGSTYMHDDQMIALCRIKSRYKGIPVEYLVSYINRIILSSVSKKREVGGSVY